MKNAQNVITTITTLCCLIRANVGNWNGQKRWVSFFPAKQNFLFFVPTKRVFIFFSPSKSQWWYLPRDIAPWNSLSIHFWSKAVERLHAWSVLVKLCLFVVSITKFPRGFSSDALLPFKTHLSHLNFDKEWIFAALRLKTRSALGWHPLALKEFTHRIFDD